MITVGNNTIRPPKCTLHFLALLLPLFLFLALPAHGQSCDMGNAYTYTDGWVVGGADEDGDGADEHNVNTSPDGYAVAWGAGAVENDYNTCGHYYFVQTTMTYNGETIGGFSDYICPYVI